MRSIGSGLIAGFFIISLVLILWLSNGTSTPPSILMATDKTHYDQGETIKLEVTNNLDSSVWYIDYPQYDLVFWGIEKAQDDVWRHLEFRLPVIEGGVEVCRLILYERPVGDLTEMKPNSALLYQWNQKICLFETVTAPSEPGMLEQGRYRFALTYSLYTVKSGDTETEPWKRPIELGETKIVYSNEFVVG